MSVTNVVFIKEDYNINWLNKKINDSYKSLTCLIILEVGTFTLIIFPEGIIVRSMNVIDTMDKRWLHHDNTLI